MPPYLNGSHLCIHLPFLVEPEDGLVLLELRDGLAVGHCTRARAVQHADDVTLAQAGALGLAAGIHLQEWKRRRMNVSQCSISST